MIIWVSSVGCLGCPHRTEVELVRLGFRLPLQPVGKESTATPPKGFTTEPLASPNVQVDMTDCPKDAACQSLDLFELEDQVRF